MREVSFLDKKRFKLTDNITLHIPTVKEIRGDSIIETGLDTDEQNYYKLVNLFTATSSDFMVAYSEQGRDFTKIPDYQVFCEMFGGMSKEELEKSYLLFENINLANFELSINSENETIVLYDKTHDLVIDELMYMRISAAICQINFTEKTRRKPANETAKEYIVERTKVKA